MGKKPYGPGLKGLLIGLALAGLAGFAAVYLSGALPGDAGRWLGLSTTFEDAEERFFALDVRDGKVPDGLRLIRVAQGDIVTLKWTADRPLTLHLHGYDIEKEVEPGLPTEFAFTAYAAGRFPIEVHPQGEEPPADLPALAYLEVYPR